MDHAEKDLLKQAFWQAFEEKQSEELAASEPAFRPSAYHLRRVSRILGINVQREADRRYYLKKRVITLILAAALLLAFAVTVYAYREAIFGFIESVFDDHNEVGFWEIPADAPTMIEEVYELGYVPEGYALARETAHERGVRYIFENEKGTIIDLSQTTLDADTLFGIDNERGEIVVRKYGKRDVYCYFSNAACSYLWQDSKYALFLYTSEPLSEEEILKIMDGIQTKK